MAVTNLNVRIAPPYRAAEILRSMGYPVSGKFLRHLYKAGKLPGTWTGKRVLIPIAKAIDLFENGSGIDSTQKEAIRAMAER